jgi:ElaB/YqjD/DUF883 family membrane-anchored ribosome-binding protein
MAIQFFNKNNKITDALDALGAAAREKKEAFGDTLEDGQERVAKAAKTADKEVHANPWMYIGAAAGVALLLGFIVGRADKKEKWER